MGAHAIIGLPARVGTRLLRETSISKENFSLTLMKQLDSGWVLWGHCGFGVAGSEVTSLADEVETQAVGRFGLSTRFPNLRPEIQAPSTPVPTPLRI